MTFLAVICVETADANSIGEFSKQIDGQRGQQFSLGVCIRNCAQCKKMYGPYFQGQLCADSCLKFKGKMIPDCEDVASIAPYIGKLGNYYDY